MENIEPRDKGYLQFAHVATVPYHGRLRRLVCLVCRHRWQEDIHELWNVAALTCPGCGTMLALKGTEFSGDSNYQDPSDP